MILAPASIGRRLLFSFSALASLILLSALIGVSGFRFVEKTEQKVVESAIPSMIEAREISLLSARITSSVQELANARFESQRRESGQQASEQLESLLMHIKSIGVESFDAQVLYALETSVQNIIDTIANLGTTVEEKLWLNQEIKQRVEAMRLLADELEDLTRTQVLNTSTVAVANVTHIYDLLESNRIDDALKALDTLVEVDMDMSERLHELHLLAYQLVTEIEESRTVSDVKRISELKELFDGNLKIIQRRVITVEDPTRSELMLGLVAKLNMGSVLFDLLLQRGEAEARSEQLTQQTLEHFAQLNTTVGVLINESNSATTAAIDELTTTLNLARMSLLGISFIGLMIIVIIMWRVVYRSVVRRLDAYSSALQSIAIGKHDIEIDTSGSDELARMGKAIVNARDTAKELVVVGEAEKKAKQALQDHKDHLEELVTERTHQLVEANDRLEVEVDNHAEARKEAEQANRAKSAFLATMSHEIRTPMNGVLGTAALLKEEGLSRSQAHYVDVINRSGKALLELLNDVLDYSKIEAGKLAVRNAPFNLKTVVNDVFELFQSRSLEKQLDLNMVIGSDVKSCYLGDDLRLRQVLSNLVGNAIKFTHQGHVDIFVDVEGEDSLYFEVSDSGVGIEEDAQSSLFNAFAQAEQGISQAGGTGLGLAISQKIVEAFGSTIELDSEVGVGSTFSFVIKLEEAEECDNEEQVQHEPAHTQVIAKVLLVEDNPVNSMVAKGFLEKSGHQVLIAEDGRQARDLYQDEEFDIALLDINLPDCNGVELLQELKTIDESLQREPIPMIAVSAHVFSEDVESYLASGFNSYLAKPINKEQLEKTVNRELNGRMLILDQVIDDSKIANSPQREEQENMTDSILEQSVIEQDINVLGTETVATIIRLFIESSEPLLEELQQSSEAGDGSKVKSLTHKLKGSAGSLGLEQLRTLCHSIEAAPNPNEKYLAERENLQNIYQQSLIALKPYQA
ncbi:TMAO reductase system sensor histidine kinase/response regulator TorS [Vibrio maerlii]|uniref:TMAO reductase system sensor histidine kinase/response regulator TorS n=1 Tax=Vibrio maerlii TaxID=2231648 RepID=UPI000E3D9BCD|nr:TMAO reductase system sensor histidine kinase/response regulator TorS [Vibrio maerlii]